MLYFCHSLTHLGRDTRHDKTVLKYLVGEPLLVFTERKHINEAAPQCLRNLHQKGLYDYTECLPCCILDQKETGSSVTALGCWASKLHVRCLALTAQIIYHSRLFYGSQAFYHLTDGPALNSGLGDQCDQSIPESLPLFLKSFVSFYCFVGKYRRMKVPSPMPSFIHPSFCLSPFLPSILPCFK